MEEARLKRIIEDYRRKSEELLEQNIDEIISYINQNLQDERLKDSLISLGIDWNQLVREVQKEETKNEIKKIYLTHAQNFTYVFFENKNVGELTKRLTRMCGFDFEGEAKDLKKVLSGMSELSNEDVVGHLLNERGLYAARAVIGKVPDVTIISPYKDSALNQLFMNCIDAVCMKKYRDVKTSGI
jgi:hypothetical protein